MSIWVTRVVLFTPWSWTQQLVKSPHWIKFLAGPCQVLNLVAGFAMAAFDLLRPQLTPPVVLGVALSVSGFAMASPAP
ncbi:hypothetical protein Y1Q_0007333 [Alligator mississippiensis]|uniref:Uncharacterized protein n=1 Tax=Alligator mississippiensis TaxID=8496 RepID=A0A151P7L4_ALLMI|nr:hypothetical protein Y1Q_0007333 [Alligator mississippiensis]